MPGGIGRSSTHPSEQTPSCTHVTLQRQYSKTSCILNSSFGCDAEGMWVTRGCRGRFLLNGQEQVRCGFEGQSGRRTYHCGGSTVGAVPTTIRECNCQTAGDVRLSCVAPAVNASLGCESHPRGNTQATCCAPGRDGCRSDSTPCTWRGDTRLAWLHTPKSGTSFLVALAHLANRNFPAHATISKREPTGWNSFFSDWPHARWFKGSATFWNDGIAHAAVSPEVFDEFKGRFFAMIRDPRDRGWSAYHHFVAPERRESFPPEAYARCIEGLQVGILAGQMSSKAYGSVDCHLIMRDRPHCVRGSGDGLRPTRGTRGRCRPFVPNVALAQKRLAEGFAFVGLSEEWAMSICLFCAKFNVPCLPQMFLNSRPTPASRQWSNASADDSTTMSTTRNREVFADPYDMELHVSARRRFEADLREHDLSRERCVRHVCPSAASFFQLN